MTWDEWREATGDRHCIESTVLAKLGSRLREFTLDESDNSIILRGRAKTQHVKQLAQEEVISLTRRHVLRNCIEVG